jgi:hypothetical protein
MSLFSAIQNIALAPSVAIGNAISGIFGVQAKTTTQQLQATVPGKILGTAIAATAVALGGALIAEAGPATVAKALIPTTTKGKIIAAVAVPIVGLGILKNPEGAIATAGNVVSSTANFIGNASDVVANPSIAGVVTTVKENPIVSAAAAIGVAGLISGGVGLAANTLATYTNSTATRANTASAADTSLPVATSTGAASYPQDAVNYSTPVPQGVTGMTATSTTQRRKTRKKTSPQALHQTISQRVNVEVNQNRVTKKYLNRIAVTV